MTPEAQNFDAGLLDSMTADELADELAERIREGYDESGLWESLRRLAGNANGLASSSGGTP
jgi:hypothetical protein